MRKTSCLLMVAGAAIAAPVSGAWAQGCALVSPVLYVDDDAAPGGDGSSWASAYRFPTDALAAAATNACITEIRIAEGTYFPDRSNASPAGTGNTGDRLRICRGLTVSGGWRGLSSGGDSDDYNPDRFVTTISGEIGNTSITTDNSTGFIVVESTACAGVDSDVTTIQGLRFTAQHANLLAASSDREDVGIRVEDGSLYLAQCEFTDNLASVIRSGSTAIGGGLVWADRFGGGTLTCVECRFINNEMASVSGGINALLLPFGLVTWDGARTGATTISRCEFRGNTGESLIHHAFSDHTGLFVSNSLFVGNTVDACIEDDRLTTALERSALLVNCTFADNEADGQAAFAVLADTDSVIRTMDVFNCIFESSYAGVDFLTSFEAIDNAIPTNGPDTISNSWFSTLPSGTGTYSGLISPAGFPAGPGFVNQAAGNYELASTSPCLDRSINGRVVEAVRVRSTDGRPLVDGAPIDLSGRARYEDSSATDTGTAGGFGGVIIADLGPYELLSDGDCNTNGTADSEEIRLGTAADADGNGIIDACGVDCDGNGVEDSADIFADVYADCDLNLIPDVAACEADCDADGSFDGCEIVSLIELDANLNGIPDDCDPDCNSDGRVDTLECELDVVIILDTSGSMEDPGRYCDIRDGIESRLNEIQSNGQGEGGRVRLFRVSSTGIGSSSVPSCEESVFLIDANGIGAGVPNFADGTSPLCTALTFESWGSATALAAVASDLFWSADARRIIIPISDEGPCSGGNAVGANEIDIIDLAIEKATDPLRPASVYPILEADTPPAIVDEAQRLVDAVVVAGNSDAELITQSTLGASGPFTTERIVDRIMSNILNLDQTCAVCRPDCPVDLAAPFGVLDLADITAFITAFQAQDPAADLALPFGVFDLDDLNAFVAIFQQGCP